MSERPARIDLAPPPEVVQAARATMGAIDLDPYSTPSINGLVLAARFYDRDSEDLEAVLARPWEASNGGRLFAGIPAGAGATRRLLNKILREYRGGRINEAFIWIAHNETLIRAPWIWDFPLCLPFRRLRPCYWEDELERWQTVAPSDWSALLYLPPASPPEDFYTKLSRFHSACSPLGRIVFDSNSGEDEWQRAYELRIGSAYDYRS